MNPTTDRFIAILLEEAQISRSHILVCGSVPPQYIFAVFLATQKEPFLGGSHSVACGIPLYLFHFVSRSVYLY